MSITFFIFVSSKNYKVKIFLWVSPARATSISALSLRSGVPTHILVYIKNLFIGLFTVENWWEAAEVEDISMLILYRYFLCGSKDFFSIDDSKNVACTLTVFGRWLWIESTTGSRVQSISVDIWYWFYTGTDKNLLRLRECINSKKTYQKYSLTSFWFLGCHIVLMEIFLLP